MKNSIRLTNSFSNKRKGDYNMGAWGYEVLENDTALDLMYTLEKYNPAATNFPICIEGILNNSDYLDELLLAVEIVDISLNGVNKNILGSFYSYKNWFLQIETNPMPHLRALALSRLNYICEVESEESLWLDSAKREKVLKKIEKRLKADKKEK